MSARSFAYENIREDGKAYSAMRITCAECSVSDVYVQRGAVRRPPIAAEQYFRNRGWRVGGNCRGDRCPNCQKGRPELKIVSAVPEQADAPREMSREDRRIIFAKIDEIYLNDKSGYQPPWTDAAVARDLGVPRAWVAKVREELFGPEGSNPDFDAFLEKAAPIITETKNLFRAAQAQLEQAKALALRIEELERIGRRVEREIGKTA